jgi:heme oxygenase (biliverdin-IX-beta and delta-forming)
MLRARLSIGVARFVRVLSIRRHKLIEWLMHHDLLSRLKNETGECHTQLENALDLMRPSWKRDDYVALLEGFYGFVAPWEAAVAAALPDTLHDFFAPRRKAAWLAADLCALTGETDRADSVVLAAHMPPMNTPGRVFGSLYVMEGSTLGGRFIAPHVASALQLRAGHGNAYFDGYGARTGSMWNAFRETAAASVPVDQCGAAIESARATFEGLHAWLVRAPIAAGATA